MYRAPLIMVPTDRVKFASARDAGHHMATLDWVVVGGARNPPVSQFGLAPG
jgi:hypothetical protein